jgi:hypothetical protein
MVTDRQCHCRYSRAVPGLMWDGAVKNRMPFRRRTG